MAKRLFFRLVLSAFSFIALPATAAADASLLSGLPASELLKRTEGTEMKEVLALLYRGRPDSALALAERHIAAEPEEPLPYLIKARVLRETLPEQDDNKELVRRAAAPVHKTLEQAIEICEKRLDREEGNIELRFYRGWAWMFRAQLHALGGSYWSAGRAAARGNKDLKKYLSEHPDDPDAKGIMGTFLYFADTLPAVIKFIKTLFLIPGGDRERGLEYLEYACNHEGLLTTDHRIILAAIHTMFEGRFEEGVDAFTSLLERYPRYLRLVEPVSVAGLFFPGRARELRELEATVISRYANDHEDEASRATIQRLSYHRSYANMFFDTPSLAIREFTALLEEAPERPDWLIPLSLLNLGCLYANTGEVTKAHEVYLRILEDDRMEEFHNVASKMVEHLGTEENALMEGEAGFIPLIYNLDSGSAEDALEQYRRLRGETVQYDFYRGEAHLIAGDIQGASESFARAIERDAPTYAQSYQMLASIRMAEIMGVQGDFEAAEDYLEKALDFYHKEFLTDMLIESRKRFFSRLSSGKLQASPSLLLADPNLFRVSSLE